MNTVAAGVAVHSDTFSEVGFGENTARPAPVSWNPVGVPAGGEPGQAVRHAPRSKGGMRAKKAAARTRAGNRAPFAQIRASTAGMTRLYSPLSGPAFGEWKGSPWSGC
jgi:hypothetical protein